MGAFCKVDTHETNILKDIYSNYTDLSVCLYDVFGRECWTQKGTYMSEVMLLKESIKIFF